MEVNDWLMMSAGGLGVRFDHPEEPIFTDKPATIAPRVGWRKPGDARRAHLRLVKQVRAHEAARLRP